MNLLFLQFDGSLNKIDSTGLSRMADDNVVGNCFGRFGIVDGSGVYCGQNDLESNSEGWCGSEWCGGVDN
jgi:hypothetical protein